ncbi:sensor histidine kinase [Streptomyces malaysiensis subsp. malaysiensis]|uniref:sensor histidine kinase n=1 Tax=Streptomyces malaysiensis TaxID=92644 RepID=UPI000BFD8108|nr:histidine kinase [Streptomyces malaysiensis]QDL71186.1 sensor histidine kinase [Streptomyces malaysiensis]
MTSTGEDATGARGAPAGPLWWARRRSMGLDVLLAVASAAECAAEGVGFAHDARIPVVAGVLLGALVGSTLVLRRRWAIAVMLISIAVTPAEMGLLLGVVGLYTLASSEVPRRITAVLAGMTAVGSFLVTVIGLRRDNPQSGFGTSVWEAPMFATVLTLGLTAPPVLLGLYVRARRRLVESLRERADGLERELSLLADRAEERAEWARNEERTRIAREMHDVVAHRVSLMVVHAAALQAVALKDPEKASKNAALVGDMGRQALTELRQMLGVLRSEDGLRAPGAASAAAASVPAAGDSAADAAGSSAASTGSSGSSAAGSSAEEKPLAAVAAAASAAAEAAGGAGRGAEVIAGPRLAELEALVGQSRAAGMAVELSVEGEERRYAAPVEQTAYRVVQEALTNVHKHAPGASARVRVAHRTAEIAVQVENGPSERGAADAGLPSGGNGLVGMRERVSTLGGGFVSGATEAGGFRVSAVIPDRTDRTDRTDLTDHTERTDRADRTDRTDRADRTRRTDGANHTVRADETDHTERADRADASADRTAAEGRGGGVERAKSA